MTSHVLVSLCAAASLVVMPAAGQATPPPTKTAGKIKGWTMPRTPDGHPDLQGIWNNDTLTPLVRSAGLDHLNLTEVEVMRMKNRESKRPIGLAQIHPQPSLSQEPTIRSFTKAVRTLREWMGSRGVR